MRSNLIKKTFVLAMILIVIFTLLSPLVAAPRIIVEKPSWDFGCVTNAPRLMCDFVLRNNGDAKLEIKRVVPSCDSCLDIYLDEVAIDPGRSTIVHCVLDTRLLSGEVFRVATIESNDPLSAALQLELRAILVPVFALYPLELRIGGTVDQRRSSIEIVPLKKLEEPLSLVECDNTNIVADVFEAPPGQYHVVAEALGLLPRGRSVFGLVVRSLNTNDPPCKIVGRIDFPEDYEVIPSQLTFDAKDEPQMRILWVRQHGGKVFSLLDAVPSSSEFHCVIEPDPTSSECRIYVEARNLSSVKGQSAKITLKGMTQQHHAVSWPVGIVVN